MLHPDPFSGAALVFRWKRADRIKILAWDRTGLVWVHKRLGGCKFVWPTIAGGVMRMSPAMFAALFEGAGLEVGSPGRSAASAGGGITAAEWLGSYFARRACGGTAALARAPGPDQFVMAQPGEALLRAPHRQEDQARRLSQRRGPQGRHRLVHRTTQGQSQTIPMDQIRR